MSGGPEEVNTIALRELADAVVRPRSITFEKSWQSGDMPGDWRQPVKEAIGEMLPRSINGKHRARPGACAPLGALCESSSCTRTRAGKLCSVSSHAAGWHAARSEVH